VRNQKDGADMQAGALSFCRFDRNANFSHWVRLFGSCLPIYVSDERYLANLPGHGPGCCEAAAVPPPPPRSSAPTRGVAGAEIQREKRWAMTDLNCQPTD
jgi:hypothetical protein